MKPQNLTINGEVFDDLRQRFDEAMLLALRKMQELKIHAGTLTATVEIRMAEEADENGETIYTPVFDAQVAINLPLKGKIKVPTQEGLMMIRDPNSSGYLVASRQYTIMDMLEEQNAKEE